LLADFNQGERNFRTKDVIQALLDGVPIQLTGGGDAGCLSTAATGRLVPRVEAMLTMEISVSRPVYSSGRDRGT
jgi:hypothetical protein